MERNSVVESATVRGLVRLLSPVSLVLFEAAGAIVVPKSIGKGEGVNL